jgi:hypothetical protein
MIPLVAVSLAACGGAAGAIASASSGAAPFATTPASSGPVNPAAVPLGDGYVSTRPRVGYVDSCVTHFMTNVGSQLDGPWIDTRARTWDYLTKLTVNGRIRWPSGFYEMKIAGGTRVLRFNDLPIDHPTGIFPIQSTSAAFQYDHNGNHIAAQTFHWSLPLHPRAATAPGCTNGGPIGVLDDGVVLFNALDGEGRDAGAHEVLDLCAGHPAPGNLYHHHDIPPCILSKVRNGTTKLVGYALDGYGIYVVKDAKGRLPGNASLDACHGTTSTVMWDGRLTRIYHYVATIEYPYTVGCFHGTPVSAGLGTGPGGGPIPPTGPPPGP